MSVTGWKSGGTFASVDRDGKVAWNNPGNALASDDSRATCVPDPTYGDWLRITNFGFAVGDIPAGATIDGIQFEYERRATANNEIKDNAIYARKTAGQVGTNQADTSVFWPNADASKTYGGATSLLGTTWTQAEILSPDFGFDLSVNGASGIYQAQVDHFRVRVYYTVAYSLSCAGGSFAETGQAAILLKTSKVSAVAGAYAITGAVAALKKTSKIIVEAGAFVVTGILAALKRTGKISAEAGAYAVTGVAATLKKTRKIAIEAGSFVVTGVSVVLKKTSKISAVAGAYAIAGAVAILNKGRSIVAEPGSYIDGYNTTSASPNQLSIGIKEFFVEPGLAYVGGEYVRATVATDLAKWMEGNVLLYVDQVPAVLVITTTLVNGTGYSGDWIISLANTKLLKTSKISAAAGSFVVTGIVADLIKHSKISPAAGSFVVIGTAAALIKHSKILADAGAYVVTGYIAKLICIGLRAIGVLLDEALVMEQGKTYNLRIRRRDDSLLLNLQTIAGESNAVYFEVPIHPDGELPGIQDLAMFGERALETAPCIVKSIERGPDLTAKLYLVDAAPEIHDADQGIIPPFDSLISIPAAWYVPEVYTVQSDSTVGARNSDGSWSPRIVAALTRPASWVQADIIQVEALFRPANTQGPWASVSALSADMAVILTPVFEGVQYEFRLRYIKADGSKGNWSELHYHTVVGGPESLPDITNLVAVYRDGRTALVWDAVRDVDNPVISYEIRKGDGWGSAEIMGRIKDPLYILPGDGKYWVAAVAGLIYSGAPVYLLIVGAILNQNVVAEYDEQATGWTGTLTDCYVDGSDFLQLDVVDGEVVEAGTYEIPAGHIVDVGEPMPCVVSVAYAMVGSNINDLIDDVLEWDSISDMDGDYAAFCGVRVQMQLAGADGVFGTWQDFAPGAYVARKFNFQLLLTSLNVEVTPIVQSFAFLVDMPDRMETGNDLGIADTGASITFTKPFQVAPNVQVSIIDALAGDHFELSNITITGFDLIVKNGGAGVHRHVNWLAEGY